MIDLHSHILPNIDDGAQTLEESVNMMRASESVGVTDVLATPHTYEEPSGTDIIKIKNRFSELTRALVREGIRTRLHLGAEIYMHPNLPTIVDKYPELTINGAKRFVLVEFPAREVPFYAENIIFELAVRGIIPVIAHPERCLGIQKKPEILVHLIENGALTQMNAGSLLGHYGWQAQKTAKKCLKLNLIHTMASDMHRVPRKGHPMVDAKKAVLKYVDEQTYFRMIQTTPESFIR